MEREETQQQPNPRAPGHTPRPPPERDGRGGRDARDARIIRRSGSVSPEHGDGPRPAPDDPQPGGRPRREPDRRGPHHPNQLPTKTSIGIILCRVAAGTGRLEVLLVHKRYTYAFAEFVHGRYARGRAGTGASQRAVAALFDHMTVEELLDVWSLNFEQMWYRIWLSRGDKRDLYNKKHAKFQSAFMCDDGGAALRRAVMQARGRGSLLWEVPKGRRLNPREADSLCAVRELREETGVAKSEYILLPRVKRRVAYVNMGTRYVCAYYVALANPRLARNEFSGADRPALREIHNMGEVSEVRWQDIERLRLLDCPDSRLESLVAPAFRLVKLYLRGRWASRRNAPPLPDAPFLPARAPGADEGAREPQEDDWHDVGRPGRLGRLGRAGREHPARRARRVGRDDAGRQGLHGRDRVDRHPRAPARTGVDALGADADADASPMPGTPGAPRAPRTPGAPGDPRAPENDDVEKPRPGLDSDRRRRRRADAHPPPERAPPPRMAAEATRPTDEPPNSPGNWRVVGRAHSGRK